MSGNHLRHWWNAKKKKSVSCSDVPCYLCACYRETAKLRFSRTSDLVFFFLRGAVYVSPSQETAVPLRMRDLGRRDPSVKSAAWQGRHRLPADGRRRRSKYDAARLICNTNALALRRQRQAGERAAGGWRVWSCGPPPTRDKWSSTTSCLSVSPTHCPVLSVYKFHLRDERTDKEKCLLQRVNESQRRRHGVTAAIVVDVVGVRACLFVCPSVRPSVLSSLRWTLTLYR